MWRVEGILWDFAEFILTDKCNLVSVIFILDRQTLLNAVKLDEATQDRGVTIDRFACFREATNYLRQIFLSLHYLHIEVGVLSLVFREEVFKVLVHSMKESIDFF